MLTLQKKMDVVANNMANVSTTGFKKDTLSLEGFPDVLASRLYDSPEQPKNAANMGSMTLFNNPGRVFTNFTQGMLVDTSGNTDMAINADTNAFFSIAVAQKDGTISEMLTRDGSFIVDATGTLVTKNGDTVMGEKGPIHLKGSNILVKTDGNIFQDDVLIDKLKLRSIENPDTLRKFGYNMLTKTTESKDVAFKGTIMQGRVEQSNVESIREMVDMITILRNYDANQKMIQYQDATLEKACNAIGSLR